MTEELKKQLNELVSKYGVLNDESKEQKKVCDAFNKEIKDIMSNENLDDWETDDYIANYSVRKSEIVDEDRLFLVLKDEWIKRNGSMQCPFIKTIEVIDDKALENAMYKGELDEDMLTKIKECSTPKLTPTLTVKRKGGKKGGRK